MLGLVTLECIRHATLTLKHDHIDQQCMRNNKGSSICTKPSKVESAKNIARVLAVHASFLGTSVLIVKTIPSSHAFLVLVLLSYLHQKEISEWLHEAAHFSLHANKLTNDRFSNLFLAPFFGVSTSSYRLLHFKHHSNSVYFTPTDPETFSHGFSTQSGFLASLLKSAVGYSIIETYISFLVTSITPLTTLKFCPSSLFKRLVPAFCVLTFWILLFIFLSNLKNLPPLLLIPAAYATSFLTAYSVFSRVRILAQHSLPFWKGQEFVTGPSQISRSSGSSIFSRVFLASDVMRFHHEHHAYPNLPYRQLRSINSKNKIQI